MSSLNEVGIKIANYKCFGPEEHQGFECLRNMNIVIGRNNSGKSALLDAIEFVTSPEANVSGQGSIRLEYILTPTLIEKNIPNDISVNSRPRQSFLSLGLKNEGAIITMGVTGRAPGQPASKNMGFISISGDFDRAISDAGLDKKLYNNLTNPYSGLKFTRLLADRDVQAENATEYSVDKDPTSGLHLQANGTGAANLIQSFVNLNAVQGVEPGRQPRDYVEIDLLSALNSIFEPDARFTRITVQQQSHQAAWEVWLHEKGKGAIRLSDSGSGLKTVLLVLVNTILVPIASRQKISNIIFGFEELENNLHPALQRRLFKYLRDFAVEKKTCFVITTHSNVVIDIFSKDDRAQIVQVIHDGKYAKVRTVTEYFHSKEVLDDLGLRASDLLQANCVVWLEGPSDRIYFNKWIELFANDLKEGTHYQCVFYGGKLLSHLSAPEDGESADDFVNILKVSKNVVVLMDSDKKSLRARHNKTKQRIAKEVTDAGGLAWITGGREIENYIPNQALLNAYEIKNGPEFGQFDDIEIFLGTNSPSSKKSELRNKVEIARKVVGQLTREALVKEMDLKERMEEVIKKINEWNGIPGPQPVSESVGSSLKVPVKG